MPWPKGIRKSLQASKPPKKRQAAKTGYNPYVFWPPACAAEKAAFFVIFLAIAALLLMAAVPVFYTRGRKGHKYKTQPPPIICAPARPARLRLCHNFCKRPYLAFLPKIPPKACVNGLPQSS